ncbi:hypothetical protein L873DRAFT_1027938 [Choiromyces venosus 120613-1]|uniref:Uncharacterized protein n=1 Tax=Choiromyces venosus 120613-1 TaxID=1336337 RepID=A0A3N4JNU7_9PEZI|nr:hypothetical protein L873DRAFT_1027938 [Choiromyces venosus 120613-1]
MSDLPPPKRHRSSEMKTFTTYYPAKKYSTHISQAPSHSIVSYCYPLSLLPLATIRVYQSREFTPLRAPCRNCGYPADIELVLQKIFLTVERLVSGGVGKLNEKEKNEENNWAVNYEAGILEPTLFGGGGFKSGKLVDSPYFPFEGERAVEEFAAFIRDRYGIVLDDHDNDHDAVKKGKEVEAPLETVGKLSKASPGMTPPETSPPMFSQTFMSPPPSRHPETPAGSPVHDVTIPDFNDLKVLFPLLDKLERGSFAATQMMEAYADVVIGQKCHSCYYWTVPKSPIAEISPVSLSTAVTDRGGDVDVENEDDNRSSGTVFTEPTPQEYTLPPLVQKRRSTTVKTPPLLQITPEEDPAPSTLVINFSTPREPEKITTGNPHTPTRTNIATPERRLVPDSANKWYASITPRAEKRIRLENPGENVEATIKEEEEEEAY